MPDPLKDVNETTSPLANFEIIKEIGRGRSCTVQLAKWKSKKNLPVVLKIYNEDGMSRSKRDALRREARLPVLLRAHNVYHICQVFWAFTHGNQFVIVMQHCEKGSLLQVLSREGSAMFEPDACRRLAVPMLLTLAHMHSRHIMHGDIKLENLFVTERDDILLGDFGLSRTVHEPFKAVIGTLECMAPEILRIPQRANMESEDSFRQLLAECPGIGVQVDIWALGVTFYEAVCGHCPWPSSTKDGLRADIIANNVREMPPEVSSLAKSFALSMMTYDVAKRPTPQQLLQHDFVRRHVGSVQHLLPPGWLVKQYSNIPRERCSASLVSRTHLGRSVTPSAQDPSSLIGYMHSLNRESADVRAGSAVYDSKANILHTPVTQKGRPLSVAQALGLAPHQLQPDQHQAYASGLAQSLCAMDSAAHEGARRSALPPPGSAERFAPVPYPGAAPKFVNQGHGSTQMQTFGSHLMHFLSGFSNRSTSRAQIGNSTDPVSGMRNAVVSPTSLGRTSAATDSLSALSQIIASGVLSGPTPEELTAALSVLPFDGQSASAAGGNLGPPSDASMWRHALGGTPHGAPGRTLGGETLPGLMRSRQPGVARSLSNLYGGIPEHGYPANIDQLASGFLPSGSAMPHAPSTWSSPGHVASAAALPPRGAQNLQAQPSYMLLHPDAGTSGQQMRSMNWAQSAGSALCQPSDAQFVPAAAPESAAPPHPRSALGTQPTVYDASCALSTSAQRNAAGVPNRGAASNDRGMSALQMPSAGSWSNAGASAALMIHSANALQAATLPSSNFPASGTLPSRHNPADCAVELEAAREAHRSASENVRGDGQSRV